ncbi:PAS domain-containing protein, partial [candidate division KSB1 bacterium]
MANSGSKSSGKDLQDSVNTNNEPGGLNESLQDLKERNQALLKALPGSVFRIGKDGTYLETSSHDPAHFPAPPLELIGSKVRDVMSAEQSRICMSGIKKTLHSRSTQIVEYQLDLNGEMRDLEARIAACGDDEVLIFTQDITDRKALRESLRDSEEKFQLISDQIFLGITIIQDGLIKFANEAMVNLSEYTIPEMMAWSPEEFAKVIHPEDRDFAIEQARKKQAGETKVVTHYSYRIITKSGAAKWIEQYSKSIPFRGKTADLVTVIDITAQKQFESDLKQSQEEIKYLSRQMEQFSLSVADMISTDNLQEVFKRISDSIIKYSDYRRVLISLFTEIYPYREIIGYGGIDEKIVDNLRRFEMPKSKYMLIKKGIPLGQMSYYVPHTMKDIFIKGTVVFGSGPAPEIEGAWHPEDNLFVCMNDREGNLIGVISVDESKSGRRPTDETVRPLEIFSSIITQIIVYNKAKLKLKDL